MRRSKGISSWRLLPAWLLVSVLVSGLAQAAQPSSAYLLATSSDLSRAALNDDGSYVVATSVQAIPGTNGPIRAVEVQRFDRRGMPLAAPIRVATPTGSQTLDLGGVASDGLGNFAVVWQRRGQLQQSLRVQRFNAAGNRVGSEIEVSRDETLSHSISMNLAGAFAVGWTTSAGVRLTYPTLSAFELLVLGFDSYFLTLSNTMHIRQFDAFARPVGDELQVVETAADSQRATPAGTRQPSQVAFLDLQLDLDDLGNGIALWLRAPTRSGNSSLPPNTLAQRFDANGAARGPRFATDLVLGRTGFDSVGNAISVARAVDGVVGLRLAAGAVTSTRFPIASRTSSAGVTVTPDAPAISVSPNGGFVVAWSALREAVLPGQTFPERTGSTIAIQRFDAAAVAQGAPVLLGAGVAEATGLPFAASPSIAYTGAAGDSILTQWFQSAQPFDNGGIPYAATCCTGP